MNHLKSAKLVNYPEFTIFTHLLAMINDYRQLVMVFVLIRGVWDHS